MTTTTSPSTPSSPKPIFDFLKSMTGILTMAVVLVHMRDLHFVQAYSNVPLFVDMTLEDKLVEIFTRYAVPIFVFISAFKFRLNLQNYMNGEQFQFIKYAKTRVRRLLVPYVIWTLIFLLIRFAMDVGRVVVLHQDRNIVFINTSELLGIFAGYGNFAFQLWFIPMIFFVSLFIIFCNYKLRLSALPYIVFALHFLNQIFGHLEYMPFQGYFNYIINFELGMICAVIYSNTRRAPYPMFIIMAWIAISFIRLFNTDPTIDNVLNFGSVILTPLALYVLFIDIKLSTKNFLFKLDYYSWPIFLLQAPFLVSWMSNLLNHFHMYNFWTRFLGTALVIIACIAIYRLLIYVAPKTQKLLF